jgi:hypothetical protein
MNGAMALPPPNTIKMPNNSKTIITGANQNFLRSFIKSQRSLKMSIIIPFFFILTDNQLIYLQQTHGRIHPSAHQTRS